MTEQIKVAVENEIYSVFIVIALHEENTPFWNLNALAHLGKSNDIDFIKVLKERKLKKLRLIVSCPVSQTDANRFRPASCLPVLGS